MTTRRRPSLFSISGLGRLARRATRLAGAWQLPPATRPARRSARTAEASLPRMAPGLQEVVGFGSNPGGLRMLAFSPPVPPPPGAPLIVVLHGCQQEAAGFARDAGWMDLAVRLRCALVLPVQVSANSHGRCFNWFRPEDTQRDSGEAMSIRQMVRSAVRQFGADPRRVFIVGLSAGGAMAAAMLAAYPRVFAGGAVVAGMPVGAARSPGVALLRMGQADAYRSAAAWAEAVRGEGAHKGAWPVLSVWQGLDDTTVAPRNAENLAVQWTALQGLPIDSLRETLHKGDVRQRSWGRHDRPAVELWTLPGLGHGYPVDPGAAGHGVAGDHVLPAAVAATPAIARFWRLV